MVEEEEKKRCLKLTGGIKQAPMVSGSCLSDVTDFEVDDVAGEVATARLAGHSLLVLNWLFPACLGA